MHRPRPDSGRCVPGVLDVRPVARGSEPAVDGRLRLHIRRRSSPPAPPVSAVLGALECGASDGGTGSLSSKFVCCHVERLPPRRRRERGRRLSSAALCGAVLVDQVHDLGGEVGTIGAPGRGGAAVRDGAHRRHCTSSEDSYSTMAETAKVDSFGWSLRERLLERERIRTDREASVRAAGTITLDQRDHRSRPMQLIEVVRLMRSEPKPIEEMTPSIGRQSFSETMTITASTVRASTFSSRAMSAREQVASVLEGRCGSSSAARRRSSQRQEYRRPRQRFHEVEALKGLAASWTSLTGS